MYRTLVWPELQPEPLGCQCHCQMPRCQHGVECPDKVRVVGIADDRRVLPANLVENPVVDLVRA